MIMALAGNIALKCLGKSNFTFITMLAPTAGPVRPRLTLLRDARPIREVRP